MSKIVALDFDVTVTDNIEVIHSLVKTFQSNGYTVVVVTSRNIDGDNKELLNFAESYGLKCIFAEGLQKKEVCSALGIAPHIWIDDNPSTIPDLTELSSGYAQGVINSRLYQETVDRNKEYENQKKDTEHRVSGSGNDGYSWMSRRISTKTRGGVVHRRRRARNRG